MVFQYAISQPKLASSFIPLATHVFFLLLLLMFVDLVWPQEMKCNNPINVFENLNYTKYPV
jgi:hypothetical protein